jgi:Ca-activated chloride channel family protein
MSVIRPDIMVLLPGVALLVAAAIVAHWRRARRLVGAYGGPTSAARLTGRRLERFPFARLCCLLVATAALTVAGAGVERERQEPVAPPTPIDLVIAVDVSHSMSGADVAPSRIGRARALVGSIVDEAVADRVALSLFADWPFGLVPLTHDGEVLEFFTPWITTELVPLRDQGTGLVSLVSHATTTWRTRARPGAVPMLLIVSDGEVHGANADVLSAIAAAVDSGMVVWTAGVGSEAGAPLFASGSENTPLLDGTGQPVVARFDPTLLREIAQRGGGAFHDVSDDGGVRALIGDMRNIGGSAATSDERVFDPTAWLILLALALLLADFALDAGVLVRRAA